MIRTTRLNDAVERVDEPVLQPAGTCSHIMALHFDALAEPGKGVIRCIDNREGYVHIPGFVDRSTLRLVEMESPYHATMGRELEIEDTVEVVADLPEFGSMEFLGLEDPIVWRDAGDEDLHVYSTVPFYDSTEEYAVMYLGHASGEDLDSLRMHDPVLAPQYGDHAGGKEPVIAPPTSDGHRYNLVESTAEYEGVGYSVVRSVRAADFDGPWEYEELVLHPAHDGYEWCGGHASPGPLFPPSFLDPGDGLRVGILNGRETNREGDDADLFGAFTVGLMGYDYENGSIEWITEEPVIEDPDARTITFGSAFRQIDEDRGIVYAHVDDSRIVAYLVDADALQDYVP